VGTSWAGDRPLLEAVIEATGTREPRRRRLPTHLVVTLVVAMGLWASESVRHVLANVVAGWRHGPVSNGSAWQLPSNAAIVRARHRAGARLFRLLFHAVAGPIATAETVGTFLGGLRLMALDGTTLEVADTPANARAFGRPGSGRGAAACPQIRAVALIETGTHALCDVVLRPSRCGERTSWAGPRSISCSSRPSCCRMAPSWPGSIPAPRPVAATATGSCCGSSTMPWTPPPVRARTSTG
jgi:hypothetical protein